MTRRESRRRSRKTGLPLVVGIAWYDSTQWTKLKQIAADTEQLDDTHEEWQRNAERTERQLAADGMAVRRVPIDVDALVAWCRAQNKPVDGAARAEYTSRIVRGEMLS
jgi:hypothetical protein